MLLPARCFLFLVSSVAKIVFIQVAQLKEQKPLNHCVLIHKCATITNITIIILKTILLSGADNSSNLAEVNQFTAQHRRHATTKAS